jgi:hypothetical protein
MRTQHQHLGSGRNRRIAETGHAARPILAPLLRPHDDRCAEIEVSFGRAGWNRQTAAAKRNDEQNDPGRRDETHGSSQTLHDDESWQISTSGAMPGPVARTVEART